MSDILAVDPKEAARQEAVRREMYRRSMDSIRVANPTPQNYFVEWDGFKHAVPANGQTTLPRYLAEKYCLEMKNKLINEEGQRVGEKMIADRRKKGLPEFTDKSVENREIWDKVPRTNDKKLIEKWYAVLWLGIESEYGLDQEPGNVLAPASSDPLEDQVLKSLNRRYVPEKGDLAKEVTDDTA